MAEFLDLDLPDDPKLGHNITYFARALRAAGLPVGPGRVIDAVKAVQAAGFTNQRDFYFTLQACFVSRPEQLQLFAQTFKLYWRDPQFLERMMRMLSPLLRSEAAPPKKKSAEKRAAEALLEDQAPPPEALEEEQETRLEAELTFSGDEKLKGMDFLGSIDFTSRKFLRARASRTAEGTANFGSSGKFDRGV